MRGEHFSAESIRNKLLATTLVASLALAGCTQQEAVPTPPQTVPTAEVAPDTSLPVTEVTGVCHDEPSSDDILAVDRLLAEPANPLSAPFNAGSKGGDAGQSNLIDQQRAFRQQVAKDNGLTIFSAESAYNKLATAAARPEGIPFAEALQMTQEYMAQLGITIQVGTPDIHYYNGGRAPTSAELESAAGKGTLEAMLQAFDDMPKEYVELAGLKRIVLMSGTDTQDVAGYANADGDHTTFYADVKQGDQVVLDIHGMHHELYHMIDQAQCGNAMFMDKGLRNITGDAIYNNERHDARTPNYTQTYLPAELRNDQEMDRFISQEEKCALQQEDDQLAAQVETYSDYHPNIAEEKAELGAEIADPNEYVVVADTRFSKLWPQYEYLMARLYHRNPGIITYFAQIGRRPEPNPDTRNC